MPAYVYRAARADGRVLSGRIEAATGSQATGALVSRGLHPLSVAEATEVTVSRARRVPRRDLVIVFRSLSSLVEAGVPLDRAVAATGSLARGELGAALAGAQARLREGATLARALEDESRCVPPVALGMLAAGERGGKLGPALGDVADHLEREAELVERVRQALAYPTLIAITGLASVIVLVTVVIPKFAAVLHDLGQDLPTTTRLLVGASDLLVVGWLPLLVGTAVAGACAVSVLRRPGGRLRLERMLLRLPAIGGVRHSLATARAARAAAAMLGAGMPILAALDGAKQAGGDGAVAERIERARVRVAEGQSVSAALARERALTPIALQLVQAGEASGRLAPMLARAGELAAGDAERGLRTLVTLVEPAMIALFGAIVAFVAAALLQAVYSVRPGLS